MKKISALVLSFLTVILSGCSTWKTASSVGIIGGADGPTAIFVASEFKWWIVVAGLLVAAIIIIILCLRKRK